MKIGGSSAAEVMIEQNNVDGIDHIRDILKDNVRGQWNDNGKIKVITINDTIDSLQVTIIMSLLREIMETTIDLVKTIEARKIIGRR